MKKTDYNFKDITSAINDFFSKPRSHSAVKKILIILFSFTVVVATYFLSTPFVGEYYDFKLGDISQNDIKVKSDLRYELTEETAKLRREAYEKERVVFDRDYETLRKVVDQIRTEMQLLQLTANEGASLKVARDRLKFLNNRNLYKPEALAQTLKLPDTTNLPEWAARYATLVFENYGLTAQTPEKPVKENLEKNGAIIRTINTSTDHNEVIWEGNRIVDRSKAFNAYYLVRLSSLAEPAFEAKLPAPVRELIVRRIIQLYTQFPNVQYNEVQTKYRKELAAKSITPVNATLKKGLTIVRTGDVIDSDKLEKIKILNKLQSKTNFKFIIGIFLVMSVLAISSAFYILRFSEIKLRDLSTHTILHSLMLSLFLYGFILSRFEAITESDHYFGLFIPLGYFGIIGGLMFGARVTLIAGMYASVFFYLISGYEPATLFLGLTSVITGIYAGSRMQKRTQFFKGSLNLFIANALIVVSMDLINGIFSTDTLLRISIAFLNAGACHILVSGVLPIFEAIFNLPTKFRLMELSDYNQPLLKRMAAEASSSYQHSLMMANLSERAVMEIGGDTLLTRVGCLYHDIGKMLNPHFYAENKHLSPTSENFKKLGPVKSAQVIISHVTDGIKMAKEHRLPERIIDFIPEHHGTTTIQYFYHQALEEHDKNRKSSKSKKTSSSSTKIERSTFQYPGPKPRSKETGVVMIADSVEAASRTVAEPGREVFADLIDRIIKNKMDEDQFDECPLTLSDLKKIKSAFVHVLVSSYHSRPTYPSMDKTKALENRMNSASKRKEVASAK
ncbi:MAG: HDIG domain-containing protein [Leptospiraceae bacterium]|nr:HDIG domain-containing protein [Leptospiraceae bacterium]MCB1201389.1 HDIG domain-containing protein [Leptospiraceae bacterium]